ncbi:hypothetical protein [Algivirga pacifica]|uniref:Outer membrane protein beta-barrel domain-containing protein n=1 Tax=Algivirga pacifica TaxID=1162670 RepID=A0ABP9DMG1_9BACT
MKILFKTLLMLCLALASWHAQAQKIPNSNVPFSYFGVGVSAGLTGAGLDVSTNLTKNFQVLLEVNNFQLDNFQQEVTIDDADILADLSAGLRSYDLKLQYLPFQRLALKLVGGVSYFNTDVQLIGTYQDEVTYGDVSVDVGQLTAGSTWNKVIPYVGFGFGRAVPKRKLGLSFDMGIYHMGSPTVSLEGTNLLEPMKSQEAQLQENLNGYEWYPQMKLRLAYRIN